VNRYVFFLPYLSLTRVNPSHHRFISTNVSITRWCLVRIPLVPFISSNISFLFPLHAINSHFGTPLQRIHVLVYIPKSYNFPIICWAVVFETLTICWLWLLIKHSAQWFYDSYFDKLWALGGEMHVYVYTPTKHMVEQCVRFQNQEEWNGMISFLGGVLVFGSGIEWNGLVPRKGIFARDAEYTRPPKSAGRGRTRWNGD
jgi:hypothetical protein